jgi:hypothetical protein
VEADDRDRAAGREQIGGDRQQAIEVGQLAVDQDAQRLKRAGRRMKLRPGGTLEREIPRFADDLCQFLRGCDRPDLPAFYDQLRDFRRIAFIAQLQQRLAQFALAQTIDQR